MGYATVSAKIPRRLKELMDRYDVKPAEVIRRALEREVRLRALSAVEEELKKIRGKMDKVSDELVVKLIREGRMEH